MVNQRFDRIESAMREILSKIDMLTKKMAVSFEIEVCTPPTHSDLSLETRINRTELLLYRTPLADFQHTDMMIDKIMPKTIERNAELQMEFTPDRLNHSPAAEFGIPDHIEGIQKTLNFDTAGMTEEAREDPEPSPISVKFESEENKTANNIGTAEDAKIAEETRQAEEDDNDTIEEASGDEKMSLGSGDDEVDPAEGAPEWFKQYAEKTLARFDNIFDEAKWKYRQYNSEPGS